MAFMPARPDLDAVVNDKAAPKASTTCGTRRDRHAATRRRLVVDIYGKQEGGTIVGDNLFHYIMRATKGGGLVVDGSIRDLEGISEIDMPAYFRSVHPSYIMESRWRGERSNSHRRRHCHAGRCGDRRSRRCQLRSPQLIQGSWTGPTPPTFTMSGQEEVRRRQVQIQ